MAVEDGGDLAGAAQAAGGTLAELGAGLGDELRLGHEVLLSSAVRADRQWGADGFVRRALDRGVQRGLLPRASDRTAAASARDA
ncbi:hypothetical protein GCM10023221_12370 [Luteimicrobium xylanilyticum]